MTPAHTSLWYPTDASAVMAAHRRLPCTTRSKYDLDWLVPTYTHMKTAKTYAITNSIHGDRKMKTSLTCQPPQAIMVRGYFCRRHTQPKIILQGTVAGVVAEEDLVNRGRTTSRNGQASRRSGSICRSTPTTPGRHGY